MILLYLATLVVGASEITTLTSYVGHEDSAVQIRALETLIDLNQVLEEQIVVGWSNDELHYRERLANALYATNDTSGLEKGWSVKLSDQERCRLALRLSEMGQRTQMIAAASAPIDQGPSWPVFSKGTLEDKWTCAIASATLLSVYAPLHSLLQRGDFPFSMPFVWDVYTFASEYTVKHLENEMVWVEEGLRAPFWTALILNDSVLEEESLHQRYPLEIGDWSIEECLDATEFVWEVGLQYPLKKEQALATLSILQQHSPTCKNWVQVARFSLREKLPRSVLKKATNIYADKDDVISSLRLLSSRLNLTNREMRKVYKYLSPLLKQDLEPTILIEVLRGLHLWFEHSNVEMNTYLSDLDGRVTDPILLVELSIVRARIQGTVQ